ncbi:MAG TPA: type 1 glutamine amidotransferase domain-containing protein [Bdellovibrio sp.]|uniref:type 1 glutamine amidotransferase domain-containing protein n=1 Tax=Bdellovibrio sp. TaxID=28201 RepID=UPI002F24D8A6
MQKTILIPLPSQDFDPTECAIPWKILTDHGVLVRFATPDGKIASCDQRMLHGTDLGIFKVLLAADRNAFRAYTLLEKHHEFQNPLKWSEVKMDDFDGLILPGGHAQGMRPYLESKDLQNLTAAFFSKDKPVGAICHGVVLVVRSQLNGASVLKNRRTTSLLARQELLAWRMTRLWLGDYYRTYPQTVEAEVRANLASPAQFISGPIAISRDSEENLKSGFCVRDGNYLSARWPGDAHTFAYEFLKML